MSFGDGPSSATSVVRQGEIGHGEKARASNEKQLHDAEDESGGGSISMDAFHCHSQLWIATNDDAVGSSRHANRHCQVERYTVSGTLPPMPDLVHAGDVSRRNSQVHM
ncbi:MAG: hypothetical protein M5U01_20565 [Ardenticatenaceae bacterium]|nr:hypothetical protein [Ardenticatenaceae bacterium]